MTSIVKSAMHWASTQKKPTSPTRNDLCETCGMKPKFVERGVEYPYCSRSCARDVQGNSPTECLLESCRATGKPALAGFCSTEHARHAVRIGSHKECAQCKVRPLMIGDLCVTCNRRPSGVRLRELKKQDGAFQNLVSEVRNDWISNGPGPFIDKVYEIMNTRETKTNHEVYRRAASGAEDVIRSYYSDQCLCDMGVKLEGAVLCDHKSCGICSVIKSSFKTFKFDAMWETGVYGEGIYSYQNPAESNKAGSTSCTTSPYRVMVACDVVANTTIEWNSPVFVKNPTAIIPIFIIMYTL